MAAARARSGRDRGPAKPAARSDVYTGLLALALLAQIAGAIFLYLDYSEYPQKPPPAVSDSSPSAKRPAPAPPPADGGAEKEKGKQ